MKPIPAKLVSEVISVEFDFTSVLQWGDNIASAVISAEVFSGLDYSPSSIISGAVSLADKAVTQKFADGMAGVVYNIIAKVTTDAGRVYNQVRVLAILSDLGSFGPSSTVTLTGSLPDGTPGVAYSANLNIAGGYAPYDAMSVIVGTPPPWMNFTISDSLLVCSGTPTETATTTYNFTPRVQDSAGTIATSAQEIQVLHLTISGDLEDGVRGDVISGAYTQVNGVEPVTYEVLSGTFPPGITLNADGTYDGTFSTAGAYSWVIRGTDAVGSTDDLDDSNNVATGEFWLTRTTTTPSLNDELWVSGDGISWPIATTRVPAITDCELGANYAGNNAVLIVSLNDPVSDLERHTEFDYGSPLVSNIEAVVSSIARVRSYEGVVCLTRATDNSQFRYSTDKGVSWNSTAIPATGEPTSSRSDIAKMVGGPWMTFGMGASPQYFWHALGDTPPAVDGWTQAEEVNPACTGMPMCCNGDVAVVFSSTGSDFFRTGSGLSWSLETLAAHDAANTDSIAIGDVFLYAQGDNSNTRILRSVDAGLTWNSVVVDATVTAVVDRFTYGVGIVLACSGNKVYRSTDDGATWTASILPYVPDALDKLSTGFITRNIT